MWRGYRGRKSGPFSALEAKSRVVVIAVIWRVKEGVLAEFCLVKCFSVRVAEVKAGLRIVNSYFSGITNIVVWT